MENKENKLGEKMGIDGTLEEFIVSEFAPYLPFSFMSKTVIRNWMGKGKDFKKGFGRKMITNSLISGLVGVGIFYYSIFSLSMGTPNYTKWSEIQKQEVIQKEQETRAYLKNQFYEADKNKDSFIDLNEFYDHIKRGNK